MCGMTIYDSNFQLKDSDKCDIVPKRRPTMPVKPVQIRNSRYNITKKKRKVTPHGAVQSETVNIESDVSIN